jgi:uroporphyrinogen-III synthase
MGRLDGRTVATTRADDPGDPLEGASVVVWPTIAIEPPGDPAPLFAALGALEQYDWVVFTSGRAVASVADHVPPPGGAPSVASVGESTADALRTRGWPVDVVGAGGGAADLVEDLARQARLDGARVLFPAGSLARNELVDGLEARGARVDRVEAYRTRHADLDGARVRADLAAGVDVVAFASPSAVTGLRRALDGNLVGTLRACTVAAIGETTARALREEGFADVTVAIESSMDGLVAACIASINGS